jgi:hypothetical protein
MGVSHFMQTFFVILNEVKDLSKSKCEERLRSFATLRMTCLFSL